MNANKLFSWFAYKGKMFLFEKTQNHLIPEILQLMAKVCVFHMITELSLRRWRKSKTLWPVWNTVEIFMKFHLICEKCFENKQILVYSGASTKSE